ncbi:MAG: hypothetical protein ACJAT7_003318 [Psychromonas sp.]|jgi:hypothetical protein|uniref:TadE/TadG family type IV pilus assembly protein n=1 Tax=Psychromonas sp. TaxID=1884585 RepID=UPI0039E58268
MFNLKKNQQGLAAIEMTLVIPILLLLFFATAEFSRLLYQYNALTKVTRDASRYLASFPTQTANAEKLLKFGDLTSETEILPNLAAEATDFDIDIAGEFTTVTVIYYWQPIFWSRLPSFVSDTSFDLSFPLVTSYTMRRLQ